MIKEAVKIKERDSEKRAADFGEIVLGYTEKEAVREAQRCLQCKNPACISGCPVGIDIKKFIRQIVERDYAGAYFTIREKNNFPSICGRVCPAEYQCRKACVMTKKGQPFSSPGTINIHFLERFVGDYGMKNNLQTNFSSRRLVPALPAGRRLRRKISPPKAGSCLAGRLAPRAENFNEKVAVVGSGPAGLCCAGELAREGIKVTVFEGLHKPGGVLQYGIPPFRLPRNVLDYEIDYLRHLGAEILTNIVIGRTKSLEELYAEGYSAVFLGLGAGAPSFLNVKGENLANIYSANEFLTRVNLMSAYKFPEFHTPVNIGKHMIVIGGGNTAMDAVRAALRLQKMNGLRPNATILYRRTEVEMPARRLEIEHAKEEGIQFKFLVQPTGFSGDERGFVKKIGCLQCRLGEPDSSGRRRPVPIEGSDFELDCDVAVVAVGLRANRILTSVTPDLEVDKWGDLVVNPQTMETSIKGAFAGGDIVGGEGTVIEAMGMAKKASQAILKHLKETFEIV